jgi:hypothetical protein
VKYAYQEWPHREDTAYSPLSKNVERKREHGLLNDQFQKRHHKLLTKKKTREVTALQNNLPPGV